MIVDYDPWSTRDEVTYWIGQAGIVALLVLIAVVRFVFAVVFRVIEVGTSLICIIAGLMLLVYLFTG